MRLVFPQLAVAAALVTAGVAVAGDPESHIREGNRLRRLGRDHDALAEFRAAYAESKTPRTAGQLGLCEEAVGLWTDAAEHIGEALESASDAWVEKNRSTLQNELAVSRKHVGTVEIIGEPDGAQVMVAGRIVGTVPLRGPVSVNAGSVDVELRGANGSRTARTIEVSRGQYKRVALRIEPAAAPNVAPREAPESVTTPIITAPSSPPGSPPSARWWWVAGLSTLAVTAATVYFVTRQPSASEPDVRRPFPGGNP